ncbi:MAG: hypothetical protein ACREI1_09800, partial [Nitrospiraceae bacterium]
MGQKLSERSLGTNSILMGDPSMLLTIQKQIFLYVRRIGNCASDKAKWQEAHLSGCDWDIVKADRPNRVD